jgi:hypothetical protein
MALGSKSEESATVNYDNDGDTTSSSSGSGSGTRGNGIDLVCPSSRVTSILMDSG